MMFQLNFCHQLLNIRDLISLEQLEEKQGEQTGEQQTTNRVRKEQDIESI